MKSVRVILLLFLCFSAVSLLAETVRIRSGVVLAAEISTAAPAIANRNADAFPNLPVQPLYAVVSLRLDPLRAISIFDYSLGEYGRIFPCIAMAKEGRFEYTTEKNNAAGVHQLLFVLDAKQFGLRSREGLTLFCHFPPEDGTYNTRLIFRNLSGASFTPASRIPAAGMMETAEK